MVTFLKLNGISVMYALAFFAHTEMWVNYYRIQRITGFHHIGTLINISILLIYIAFSILCYILTKNLFGNRRIKNVLSVLWIPYFLIFTLTFASQYPITNPQDKPLPAIGLIIIGIAIVFPFYITLINFFASQST